LSFLEVARNTCLENVSSINSSPETKVTAQVGRKEKLSQLSKNYKSDQGIMAADHGRSVSSVSALAAIGSTLQQGLVV
jgi:hypothetical protein